MRFPDHMIFPRLLIIPAALLLLTGRITAQVNADSLFRTSIEQAGRKDYSNALLTARNASFLDPGRSDINIFIANIFAWQKNFDSANVYIKTAFRIDPDSPDLYDSWLNILLWNGESERLLETIDIANGHGYNNSYNILVKKLIALKSLGRYSEAAELMEEDINRNFLDSVMISSLYREVLALDRQNILSVSYSIDILPDMDPGAQHLAYADYNFKIHRQSLILRINYARRFNSNGFQAETDYYHIFDNLNYLYLNYGYSFTGDLFPEHRSGLEYFLTLKIGYEASLGGRYMYFSGNHTGIATASIAKYLGTFRLSLRPFYSFNDAGNAVSFITEIRKYGKRQPDYWNLELGYGNSPDERFILNPVDNYYQLDSYRIRLSRNLIFARTNEFKISLGYAYEEFVSGDYLNRFIIDAIFRFRLK